MKLFSYNKNSLEYNKVSLLPYMLLFIILTLLSYMYGFLEGREDKIIKLTPQEKELILINVQDTSLTFSEEKLISLMNELNIKFPHIVLAQAKVESGNYTSKIFRENHNLFGMKEARVRIHTAQGTQFNHAYYNTWRESVYDYAFYQCRYLSNINTEDEYLSYLGQSYAEATNYVSILKTMLKREKLREKFN
jgi:uncharacterized FlgJ-related protein